MWTHEIIGGESVIDVGVRADRVITAALAVDGDVAVFAHAHFLRILATRWLDLDAVRGSNLVLDTASLSILSFEREQRVIGQSALYRPRNRRAAVTRCYSPRDVSERTPRVVRESVEWFLALDGEALAQPVTRCPGWHIDTVYDHLGRGVGIGRIATLQAAPDADVLAVLGERCRHPRKGEQAYGLFAHSMASYARCSNDSIRLDRA